MDHGRLTIGKLAGTISVVGLIFAGLRSGSNDWFKLIYEATFVLLVCAVIAARYRGAGWFGFAVVGWAYFVVGFGPWIGSPPGSEPLRALNRNLGSSVIPEMIGMLMSGRDPIPPGLLIESQIMFRNSYRANREGIAHCALSILFGLFGAWMARRLARRSEATA